MQYLLDLKEGKWSYIESKGEKPSPRTGQTATLLDDGRVLVFGESSMTDGLVISLVELVFSLLHCYLLTVACNYEQTHKYTYTNDQGFVGFSTCKLNP